ncbi:MAG TPA: MarR family transcriptional regulator [Pelobium sp.]|nr:MarR family transcriptional regulator [Pelobium sp.]
MEIQKEIQNAKFVDNYQKVSVNLIFTYNWLNSMIKGELGKSKITPQQFNILRILRGQHPKPATINIIKERMLDKMSDASRIVDRLVSKELVTRTVCERDRRAVDIVISDKGLRLLAGVKLEEAMTKKFKKNISEEQASQLSDLLDAFRGY